MTKFGKMLGRLFLGVLIIAVLLSAGGIAYFSGYLPSKVAPQSFPQVDRAPITGSEWPGRHLPRYHGHPAHLRQHDP
jgi:hypothetical protein